MKLKIFDASTYINTASFSLKSVLITPKMQEDKMLNEGESGARLSVVTHHM